MAIDPVELADSLADDSIEVVGTVSPGATAYKIKVSTALQDQIGDHEARIDTLEGQIASAGTGDVDGPASATDNAVVRFDGTTGKIVQNSVVTVADSTGNMAGVGTLNTRTIANWVDGPASATDNALVRFDGTTGKLVQTSAVTVADTTGSIDNTSGSGTVTSTQFIGPVTALKSASTSVNVSSATAPSSGQVLTATSTTTATWQTPSSGSAPVQAFWWYPATAGANDDEFEGGSLGGAWTLAKRDASTGTWTTLSSSGDVSYTTAASAGTIRISLGKRRSWLLVQPGPRTGGAGQDDYWLYRQFNPGSSSNYHLRMRVSQGYSTGASSNTEGLIQCSVLRASSGRPDAAFANGTVFKPVQIVGSNSANYVATARAGTVDQYNISGPANFGLAEDVEWIYSSQATGTVAAKAWARSNNRVLLLGTADDNIGTDLTANTACYIAFLFRGDGNSIHAIDYVRELSGKWDGS